jgi:hypothetical protein
LRTSLRRLPGAARLMTMLVLVLVLVLVLGGRAGAQ